MLDGDLLLGSADHRPRTGTKYSYCQPNDNGSDEYPGPNYGIVPVEGFVPACWSGDREPEHGAIKYKICEIIATRALVKESHRLGVAVERIEKGRGSEPAKNSCWNHATHLWWIEGFVCGEWNGIYFEYVCST